MKYVVVVGLTIEADSEESAEETANIILSSSSEEKEKIGYVRYDIECVDELQS
jgi:hypothetical protein